MLEGHAERLGEVAHHVEGRVGILDIVVGEFLALYLTGKGKGVRRLLGCSIELCLLVRVLAVAERLLEVVLQEKFLVESGLLAHI